MYLLDPDIIFLNHGSFGACPQPVFDAYQNWQRKLEHQPVKFLGRDAIALLRDARHALGDYLHCHGDDLVFVPNPTTAANIVARSLLLAPGDEILTTDHEYGAMDRTWTFITRKTGAKYVRQPIPVPVTTPEAFVEQFWAGVTSHTKLIFISHITSLSALQFPVEAICRRAREAGILTFVDGAHAPGQIPLDLTALDADFYTGACHKWMMAPKGAAFLYARRALQSMLDPLVVSWGYDNPTYRAGSQFLNYHEWQGTRDLAAFLTVPNAIAFQREQGWETVRERCRALVADFRERACEMLGTRPLSPNALVWFTQMVAVPLPLGTDTNALKVTLYEQYRIEIPVYVWNDIPCLRISVQAYNTQADGQALLKALNEIFSD
jgi:isopenicillin-N epimerase